ncbi:hypothetical protein ACFFU8_18325 [Chromobacterium piscinae]|uniref:hypothetical protein n=1 Tax=Chromobacterium piscinae TaxID=686831 RepID=UPI001E320477|nr:hypothetical protein [Chromobacterium piscinae]MCD5326727.1 hypothetical protein [Chromobacterium piscinae]
MADVMQTTVQFAEEMLNSIDRELILSCAQKADDLVQSMTSAGFQLREPKCSASRLCMGGAYNPFSIHFSYDLVDSSKTREVLDWLWRQGSGFGARFHRNDDMILFPIGSTISFFLHNIDQAAARAFEKERGAATADEAQP